ncbi:MAG: di-heme oxidoredictase family protein [Planctomycetota bacterium]|nr:di-heme oxidoredictase family protein [Planctomycetota bacterium]
MNMNSNDGLSSMANFSRAVGATAFLVASSMLANAQLPLQPRMGDPIPGLTPAELNRFELGKLEFERVLSVPEGLGPIMNDTSCVHCHIGPATGGGGTKSVNRFGIAANGPNPFDPLDSLGGSLQQELSIDNLNCLETIPPQCDVVIERITPPCFGFGLIEAILDSDIQVREALPPPGVSGKAHIVTPAETPTGPTRVGRFGWKAQVATILTFTGDAAMQEMGLSNRLFPFDNSPNGLPTTSQPCDSVSDPEDGPDAFGFHKIDRMTDFQRFLAPPPQTPKLGMTGDALFNSVGCANCHVSTPFTTIPTVAETALQNKQFKPYTDFLLHDVGLTLGDGIPQGMATETEFRTAPLWGIAARAAAGLLHDARAAGFTGGATGNIDAAILAHGGEASGATANYVALSTTDKEHIQNFLMSLGRAEFDIENDNSISEADWFFLRPILTGPGSFLTPDSTAAVADLDQDGDFDLRDLAGFQRAYTRP